MQKKGRRGEREDRVIRKCGKNESHEEKREEEGRKRWRGFTEKEMKKERKING